MGDRNAYRALSETEPGLPLFLRGWWLDAACGEDGWHVALVLKDAEVQAALPYQLRRVGGLRVISQPPLTQFLGPWMRDSGARKAKAYGQQKDLMNALIDQLPAHDLYQQSWSSGVTNWLPFYWRGFSQTTRYSYVLPDLSDEAELWKGTRDNIRTDVRKAGGRNGLTVFADGSIEEFIELNTLTFRRQGQSVPYSADYVRRIDAACAARGRRRIMIARDADGRAHAGAYIVWDDMSAYYIMGGSDPELRNSGAMSLCLWEAIRFSATVTRRFDFEGSMMEPVERFFRAFGAEQVPYFAVSRASSRALQALMLLRSWLTRP